MFGCNVCDLSVFEINRCVRGKCTVRNWIFVLTQKEKQGMNRDTTKNCTLHVHPNPRGLVAVLHQ